MAKYSQEEPRAAPISVTEGVPQTYLQEKTEHVREVELEYTSSSSDINNARYRGQKGTFDDAGLLDYYKPISTYEGIHRYDPSFQWEPEEERKLVTKLNWRICAWCCLTFFALQLDRGNAVQAVSDNLLTDLGMSTDDYNTGQTIFFVCFLIAELPSQLISKRLGPDNWIPIQMVCWSIVASLQSKVTGRGSWFACRALLGIFEGGFIPDTILYLSYFFTSAELPIRLSFFWGSYQFTSIISAFLAYGILHMAGIDGLQGWRWLFALEGTLTGLIGIATWFYLPPSPCQTAGKFRGKNGWFTEREEKIMVNRIIRDDPSKGDMHNRQPLTPVMLWRCLKDYHMWPIYLIGLTWMIPVYPMTAYLTLVLKSLNFSTFETNLLTIPAYTLFIIQLIVWTWVSEKFDTRILLCIVSQIWVLPLLISLEVLPPDSSQWGRYVLAIMIVGYPYVHAILVAITSRNAGSVRTRTVASALYNIFVQAGSIIGSNIYRTSDSPSYYTGNKVLLAFVAYNMFIIVGAKIFYVKVNAKREAKWNSLTIEEKEHYLATTTDQGNKRLDFRFSH